MKKSLELLEWQKKMGVEDLLTDEPMDHTKVKERKVEINKGLEEKTTSSFRSPVLKAAPKVMSPSQLEAKARKIADKCNTLEELKNAVESFDGLSIKKTATNTVFSDGNPDANIMAIGEAPGANEDKQGIPFCGLSGQLLDNIFAACGLFREKNIYITNSVFWRPPGNRRPTPEENAACLPFVERHIALFKPKLLILVGGTSAAALLNTTESVTKIRQRTYEYKNQYLEEAVPTAVIFHPSYLLRQPSQKKIMWFDMLKLKNSFSDVFPK